MKRQIGMQKLQHLAKTILNGENPPFFIAPIPKTIIAPTAEPIKHAIIMPKLLAEGMKARVMARAALAPPSIQATQDQQEDSSSFPA